MGELTIATVTSDLQAMSEQFAHILPPHIPLDRFRATIIAQIQASPDALKADYTTLKRAWAEAAEDGILPDGRKGFINVYNEKRRRKKGNAWVEEYVLVAKWTPMALGIVERANDHGIVIDAQAYYSNDKITVVQGTDPKLEHSIDPMKPRGDLVGAYAVFKRADTQEVLRIELIGAEDMAKIRACSKQPNGLLWGKFTDQAYCKSAIRRGAKSVRSLPQTLQRTIERNDSDYDFTQARIATAGTAKAAPMTSLMPPSVAEAEAAPAATMPPLAPAAPPASPKVAGNVTDAEEVPELSREERFLHTLDERLGKAETLAELKQIWAKGDRVVEYELTGDFKNRAYELWNKHEVRVIAPVTEAAE